jgi:hypothetical protein
VIKKLVKFGKFVTKDSVIVLVVTAAVAFLYWDKIPSWLIVVVLLIAGQIVAYRLGEERRKFFVRLNDVFDTGSEDAKRQFHQKETVAALDEIARAAGLISLLLFGILILLFLLLAVALGWIK